MEPYVIIGFFIGVVFGMPFGAIGALCIQRTIGQGVYAGLLTGSASSIADVVYACIGAFGLSFLSQFLFQHQILINLLGAAMLIVIAMNMILKKQELIQDLPQRKTQYLTMFATSFAIAITNPAAILSFLFAFSVFGINGTLTLSQGLQLILGILVGTLLWWVLLVWIANIMKHKFHTVWLNRINKLFGIILIVFGIGVVINTIW